MQNSSKLPVPGPLIQPLETGRRPQIQIPASGHEVKHKFNCQATREIDQSLVP